MYRLYIYIYIYKYKYMYKHGEGGDAEYVARANHKRRHLHIRELVLEDVLQKSTPSVSDI